MSVLSKGRVFLLMGKELTEEYSKYILTPIHEKPFGYFFNFANVGKFIDKYGIIYAIYYGRDEDESFWKRAVEVVDNTEDMLKHIPVITMYEQGDFLVPEWSIPNIVQKKNIILRWNTKESLRFIFYQLTFITKPWKKHITNVIKEFASKEDNIFYNGIWNNYITYLFSLVPKDKNEIDYANKLGAHLLKTLFEKTPDKPTPQPPKKDLEVFYKDYETVIVSGIGSSTSWGLILDQKGITHLSLHYYGEEEFNIMKEPVDEH